MRLTQQTDYAMRVLIYAGTLWDSGRLASIQEIASAYAISQNHLMKVVHKLGALGLLQTQRGRNGGLRLARPPGEIRLGRVIQAVEGDLDLVACFAGDSSCPLVGLCGLAAALEEARTSFLASLDAKSLADVLPRVRSAAALQEHAVVWRHEAGNRFA